MDVPHAHKILTGTIVVCVRHKYFVHRAFPMSQKLRNELGQDVDPARRFAALAALAAISHVPLETPKTPLEMRWKRFFGVLGIEPDASPHNEISGTIIVNSTGQNDFCFQIDKSEHFIPYLLRAFMRREDPAEALAFLGEFAVQKSVILQSAYQEKLHNL